MSNDPRSTEALGMRAAVRWGLPLHYAVPAGVGFIGLLLLAAGGTAAVLGGWWLAVVLPIVLGGFHRDPRVAAIPLAVWLLWLVVAALAGEASGVARTPVAIALALAGIGAVATRMAQHAVFPATAPDAWAGAVHRLVHPGTADATAPEAAGTDPTDAVPATLDADTEAGTCAGDPTVEADMTVAFEALTPVTTAEHDALAEQEPAATAGGAADVEATPVPVTPDVEATPEQSTPEAEATPQPVTPEAEATPQPVTPEAEAVTTIPPASPSTAATIGTVHRELPVGADPAALDEGGHVSEFGAITEAHLAAANADGDAAPPSSPASPVDEDAAGDQPAPDVA